jgi:hypothetical protein
MGQFVRRRSDEIHWVVDLTAVELDDNVFADSVIGAGCAGRKIMPRTTITCVAPTPS